MGRGGQYSQTSARDARSKRKVSDPCPPMPTPYRGPLFAPDANAPPGIPGRYEAGAWASPTPNGKGLSPWVADDNSDNTKFESEKAK